MHTKEKEALLKGFMDETYANDDTSKIVAFNRIEDSGDLTIWTETHVYARMYSYSLKEWTNNFESHSRNPVPEATQGNPFNKN